MTLYEYDYENRLKKITHPDGAIEEYIYDYAGNLIMKTDPYVFDPEDEPEFGVTQYVYGFGVAPVVEIYTANWWDPPETTLFIQANGKTYEKYKDGTPTFMHTDALGSVVAVSDGDGTVTGTYEYKPYGGLLYSEGLDPDSYQFVGSYGVRDVTHSKSIMGVRLYDQETGRFVQRDPIGFWGGDYNVYLYSGNNVCLWIDPFGKDYGDIGVSGLFWSCGIMFNETGVYPYFGIGIILPGGSIRWSPDDISTGPFYSGSLNAGISWQGGRSGCLFTGGPHQDFDEYGLGLLGADFGQYYACGPIFGPEQESGE